MTFVDVGIPYAPWRNSDKHLGQWYVHQSRARFRLLMKGRQSGGTQCALAEICVDAMAYPGHIDWWVVNNLEVKPRAWRGLLDFLPAKIIAKANISERSIRLTNGSEIWVKSAAGDDSLVSESLDFAVCDEAGLWKEEAWERGISPMFIARPHARVLLVGTPRSKNWFYRMWQKGRPGPQKDADYESFHWKSEDSPFSDLKYLEERRRNMPIDLYREEYEADPIDATGGVFANVRNCVVSGPQDNNERDRFMCLGVDLARKGDFSAFIPMNSQRRAIFVERSQDDWPIQKARLAYLAFSMGARLVVDSASVGDVIVQDMRAAGYAVEDIATNSTVQKRNLIDNLRLAFQQGTIQIPPDETLLNELESYTYEILPKSNQIRYAAPEGGHDDTVIALALALWGQRGAMTRPNHRGPQSYMRRGRGESYMRRSA